METATTVVPQKPKKVPSTLLIGVLIVLLIGTGIGVYFITKPKAEETNDENTTDTGDEGNGSNGANGRNVTNHRFPLTPEQIQALIATPSIGPTPGTVGHSPDNPIYYKDPVFLTAVETEAFNMQSEISNRERMDVVRALYNIGEGMMGRDIPEQECIEHLFSQLPHVDFSANPDRKYLAFPVYGTNELKGSIYRAELQKIVNAGWESMNLTDLRHDQAPWFCSEIGLNLLVGTTWSNTPPTNHVRMSWAPRNELNFYKKFNRYWVDDFFLADKLVNKNFPSQMVLDINDPNARAAYCATGMFDFVQRWIAEIDRLDEVTKKEAFENLVITDESPNGTWYVTYKNPVTGEDENPSNKTGAS